MNESSKRSNLLLAIFYTFRGPLLFPKRFNVLKKEHFDRFDRELFERFAMRFANIRNLSCVYGETRREWKGKGREGVACRMDSRGISRCIYICPSYREIRGRRGSLNDVRERNPGNWTHVNVNVPTIPRLYSIILKRSGLSTLTSRQTLVLIAEERVVRAIEEILIERARYNAISYPG